MQEPFFIGQEVTPIRTITSPAGQKIVKGKVYIVKSINFCSCGRCYVDIGIEKVIVSFNPCGGCGKHKEFYSMVYYKLLAPVERAKIKYVVKEVEVVPAIREMEKCLS